MRPIYRLGWQMSRSVLTTYFRARYYNPEHVPLSGPLVLAANHASYIDPPLVGSGLPRDICYLARESLFRFPPMGWLLRGWNSIPVDREAGGAAGLRAVLDSIARGHAVLLFPEGTRTPDGKLQTARSGIGMIAIKGAVPVVPVRVFGTYEAFGRRARFPQPRPVAVKYGYPLNLDRWRDEAKQCSKARLKEIYRETTQHIMEAIAKLQPYKDTNIFP
jgi:1-acyl-sn-glycerol-3-phosphate acyltransferase